MIVLQNQYLKDNHSKKMVKQTAWQYLDHFWWTCTFWKLWFVSYGAHVDCGFYFFSPHVGFQIFTEMEIWTQLINSVFVSLCRNVWWWDFESGDGVSVVYEWSYTQFPARPGILSPWKHIALTGSTASALLWLSFC